MLDRAYRTFVSLIFCSREAGVGPGGPVNTFKNTSTAPSSSLGAMSLMHGRAGEDAAEREDKQDEKTLRYTDGKVRHKESRSKQHRTRFPVTEEKRTESWHRITGVF